jgi:4-amino-4-deoxy-L-arabinose transferase-like glycosyltransferase
MHGGRQSVNPKPENMDVWINQRPYLAPLVLTAVAGLLFLPGLGSRDFWAPGEPIYAEVVRVMFEKGQWLVPKLNGELFPDKPILYYWLALFVSKLAGGVNEWTVRLPGALAGIGLVLATYAFGKTFFNRQIGLISGFVIATTSRVLWESRFLRLDTSLSFFLFLGFFCFLKAFLRQETRTYYLGAYFCFALATLTKGPIGLALPGLAISSLILATGRWRELPRMHLIAGLIIVLAVISPWLILLHLNGEDAWLRDFIWIHNVQNYALKPIGHVRPFYYYLVNLPPDFLPWTLFIPGALIFYYPWRERLQVEANLALLCWFASIFLFFSASKSKIAYYLLPLFPALALFIACYLSELSVKEKLSGLHWRLTALCLYLLASTLFVAGFALPVATYKLERTLLPWSAPLSVILVAGAIGLFVSLRQKQILRFSSVLLAIFVGVGMIAGVGVLPRLNPYKSPRPVGDYIRWRLPAASQVYVYQSTMADFNYYAQRERIPVVPSEKKLETLLATSAGSFLLINNKDLPEIEATAPRQIVAEYRIGDRKWYIVRLH